MIEGQLTKLEALVGYQLRHVGSNSTNCLTEALSAENFRVAEAGVLIQIAENPGITASEIGRALNMKRSNITPIVSRFKELGLLECQEIDGRSTALRVNHAGYEKFLKVHDIVTNHDQQFFLNRLSGNEFEQFKDILFKISETLENH